MKRTYFSITLVLFLSVVFVFNSCSEKNETDTNSSTLEQYSENSIDEALIMNDVLDLSKTSNLKCHRTEEICSGVDFYPLIAGKYWYAGALVVFNDEDNLYVSFWGYGLKETHLFVGSFEDIPLNKHGIPNPGHFPGNYKMIKGYGISTYIIPLDEIPECPTIVAHAATCWGETAWAMNPYDVKSFKEVFKVRRWGYIVEQHCIERCEPEIEKYFTVKVLVRDTVAGTWTPTFLRNGSIDAYNTTAWCSDLRYAAIPSENGTYPLYSDYDPSVSLGTVSFSSAQEGLLVDIELGSTNSIVGYAYLYYGDLPEESDVCPDFRSWLTVTPMTTTFSLTLE